MYAPKVLKVKPYPFTDDSSSRISASGLMTAWGTNYCSLMSISWLCKWLLDIREKKWSKICSNMLAFGTVSSMFAGECILLAHQFGFVLWTPRVPGSQWTDKNIAQSWEVLTRPRSRAQTGPLWNIRLGLWSPNKKLHKPPDNSLGLPIVGTPWLTSSTRKEICLSSENILRFKACGVTKNNFDLNKNNDFHVNVFLDLLPAVQLLDIFQPYQGSLNAPHVVRWRAAQCQLGLFSQISEVINHCIAQNGHAKPNHFFVPRSTRKDLVPRKEGFSQCSFTSLVSLVLNLHNIGCVKAPHQFIWKI